MIAVSPVLAGAHDCSYTGSMRFRHALPAFALLTGISAHAQRSPELNIKYKTVTFYGDILTEAAACNDERAHPWSHRSPRAFRCGM
jgi:hypothetical protein